MTLLRMIEKNEDIRKLFGKRELVIIKKQLLGISLTQSEKNRLSRDIRKKLNVVRELAKYSDEFELKKGLEVKKMAEEAKQDILDSKYFPKIKRIVLFGSSVENQRTFRSDIDIAVEFDSIDLKEATEFRIKVGGNDQVEIQVYNVLPDKIKKEIDEKGKVIYARQSKR